MAHDESRTEPIRNVAFCPHCGNRAPQRLVHRQDFRTSGYYLDGRRDQSDYEAAYFVAACETCHEVLVYLAEAHIPPDLQFSETDLMWPDPGHLPRSVPEAIRNCYEEAARIKSLAPNAFAVQIRRALEALCEDRGQSAGSLHQRLQKLAATGEIPSVLAEMTDVLRLLGNLGAHASTQPVRPGHVRAIDEFFRAVIEYVYIAPGKIREFRERLREGPPGDPDDNA
jgi:hypothetical protein